MTTSKFPFVQGEVTDSKYPINFMFVPSFFNGKNAMVGTPGLTTKVDTLLSFPVRGMVADKSKKYLYVVVGNKLVLVDKDWNFVASSGVLNTSSGKVSMSSGVNEVLVSDGYDLYRVTRVGSTPSISTITSSLVYNSSFVDILDNYFISGGVDSFYYQLSGRADGSLWTATDLGSVEADPDNLLTGIVDHRQLFLFKYNSGEIHYDAGASVFPFERYPDVYIEDGIGAVHSLCKADNTIFWFNQDFFLKRLNGYTPQLASPPLLNSILHEMSFKSDIICFSFSLYGFIYLVMTFPTENKTYVLNVATGFVHQWSSGTSEGRHRANCYALFNGFNLVGDYENGKIYAIDTAVYTDANSTILRKYYSPNFYSSGNLLFHKELLIEFKYGTGLVSGQGSDPTVMFRYSNTGMRTWSPITYERKIGPIGKYKSLVALRRMGSDVNRIYEMSISDPVECVFTDLNIDVSE